MEVLTDAVQQLFSETMPVIPDLCCCDEVRQGWWKKLGHASNFTGWSNVCDPNRQTDLWYGNLAMNSSTGAYVDGRTLQTDLAFTVGMGKVLPSWRRSVNALISRSSYFMTTSGVHVREPTFLDEFGAYFTTGLLSGATLGGSGGADYDPKYRADVAREQTRGSVLYSCEQLDYSCDGAEHIGEVHCPRPGGLQIFYGCWV